MAIARFWPPHAVHPSNFFRQAVGRGFCIATPRAMHAAGQWADRGTPLNLGAFWSEPESSPPNSDKDQPARPETGADQGSGIVLLISQGQTGREISGGD
jgi:hypothetical protein